MNILRYHPSYRELWNSHINQYGAFLFHRDYMDYHQNRFEDHSLLFFDEKENLLAVLPANQTENSIFSHQGLSYGGLVASPDLKFYRLADCIQLLLNYLKNMGISRLLYKSQPSFYNGQSIEEDLYLMHEFGAQLYARQLLSVINLQHPIVYQEQRRRHIKKALKKGLIVAESNNLMAYWDVLQENLNARYSSRPVHTYEEIVQLCDRFPDNIKLFVCNDTHQQLYAGIIIFETNYVAKTQYIASTHAGRALGAVDLLIDTLLKTYYSHKRYFDFGSSHVDGQFRMNKGLLEQKEGFGARACVQDTYELRI
jgi:hypothetical protein